MDGKRFIRTIRLANILSYGTDTPEIELQPLNVLVGPNASGKSNLMEALSLLASAPRDIQSRIRAGGGVREWLWKGSDPLPVATIEVTTENLKAERTPIRYHLSFRDNFGRFTITDETIEEAETQPECTVPYLFYKFDNGSPVININNDDGLPERTNHLRTVPPDEVTFEGSILSLRREPSAYPELTYLGDKFRHIRVYDGWDTSKEGPIRSPQSTTQIRDFLLEDASNLGLVVNKLFARPPIKQKIMEHVKNVYPLVEDIVLSMRDGTIQVHFHERGLDYPIPASRISDGLLRYLCLLAVLFDPDPPPLVCVDNPEEGLHPDIIPDLADLLIEASQSSQLIVSTNAEMLVDSLGSVPESVVICEKPEGATRLRRLDAEELKPWLKKYSLGDLWTSGELGGNRW